MGVLHKGRKKVITSLTLFPTELGGVAGIVALTVNAGKLQLTPKQWVGRICRTWTSETTDVYVPFKKFWTTALLGLISILWPLIPWPLIIF